VVYPSSVMRNVLTAGPEQLPEAVRRSPVRGHGAATSAWPLAAAARGGMAAYEKKRMNVDSSGTKNSTPSTSASGIMKKPGSTSHIWEALLTSSPSGSSSPSGDSNREPGVDRTNNGDAKVGPVGRPRLGSHTPSPRGKAVTGDPVLVHREGGAASVRVAPCFPTRCTRATWSPPRRGCPLGNA
jgi:hypothetical protein